MNLFSDKNKCNCISIPKRTNLPRATDTLVPGLVPIFKADVVKPLKKRMLWNEEVDVGKFSGSLLHQKFKDLIIKFTVECR